MLAEYAPLCILKCPETDCCGIFVQKHLDYSLFILLYDPESLICVLQPANLLCAAR